MICVYFMMGAPEGSTESGFGEAGNETYGPWFTRQKKKLLWLSLGSNQCL